MSVMGKATGVRTDISSSSSSSTSFGISSTVSSEELRLILFIPLLIADNDLVVKILLLAGESRNDLLPREENDESIGVVMNDNDVLPVLELIVSAVKDNDSER
jgi:hypothetical protein